MRAPGGWGESFCRGGRPPPAPPLDQRAERPRPPPCTQTGHVQKPGQLHNPGATPRSGGRYTSSSGPAPPRARRRPPQAGARHARPGQPAPGTRRP